MNLFIDYFIRLSNIPSFLIPKQDFFGKRFLLGFWGPGRILLSGSECYPRPPPFILVRPLKTYLFCMSSLMTAMEIILELCWDDVKDRISELYYWIVSNIPREHIRKLNKLKRGGGGKPSFRYYTKARIIHLCHMLIHF